MIFKSIVCSISLKYRIALIVSLLTGILLAFMIWQHHSVSHEIIRRQSAAKELVFLNFLHDMARNALITGEYDVMQLYLQKLQRDPQLKHVAIADSRIIIVASTDPAELGQPIDTGEAEIGDTIGYTFDISSAGGRLGTVSLQFSREEIDAHDWRLFTKIIQASVSGLVAITIVGLIVGFLLTRRLDLLKTAAESIGQGDWSIRLQETGKDEIGMLAATFNTMAHNLEDMVMKLSHQANFDSLTDLPNRILLGDRLQQAIAQGKRYNYNLAVMLLDLDNFKSINDTLGHGVGDILLQEAAGRLKNIIRSSDTVARLGGDEFVIVPSKLNDYSGAVRIAEEILREIQPPFMINGQEIFITASIGIALFPQNGDTFDELLKNADIAMYHAKKVGRNTFQFFNESIQSYIEERLHLESGLRRALERNEFILHYQPQVDSGTSMIIGMEALIRWQPTGEQIIPPLKFISILEETGLIVEVGEWVLHTACTQLKEWQDKGLSPLKMSINLSPRQFQVVDIVDRIEAIVRETGCSPTDICLELTENILMNEAESEVDKLKRLRKAGFSISIDDFGTGYSSLSYLKNLPISELKIDRSFVNGLSMNENDMTIINTIISMAKHMKMNVVAEGVETEDQVNYLKAAECEVMQGFFWGKPMPADQISAMIAAGSIKAGP